MHFEFFFNIYVACVYLIDLFIYLFIHLFIHLFIKPEFTVLNYKEMFIQN